MRRLPKLTGVALLTLLLGVCDDEDGREPPPPGGRPVEAMTAGGAETPARGTSVRPRSGTERDWMILRSRMREFWQEEVDTLPPGEVLVRIGRSFLGTPYVPGTLELPGREQVVVNLEEMDCVTLVETSLAMTRFLREAEPEILDSESRTRKLYTNLLEEIRYRDGRVDGYPSRLHYFSDWIRDNESRGLVREMTRELGGVEDPRAIDYMSTHPEAYPRLADPAVLAAVRNREVLLSRQMRYRIPEEVLPEVASEIENGDIIAVTSALQGLDVAHTGIAVWQEGQLHLLHAPLVGEAVQISALPLARRLPRLESQDGIRVVRPSGAEGTDGP